MRRRWVAPAMVLVIGGAVGVAVAGLPGGGDDEVIVASTPSSGTPATSVGAPTTTDSEPDTGGSTLSAPPSTSIVTTTTAATPTTSRPPPTTRPPPQTDAGPPPSTRAPSDVSVFVANGTDSPALARRTADALIERGWEQAAVGDTNTPADRTRLYMAPGYEAEAAQLVQDLPIPDVEVVAGVAPAVDAGEAALVVVLGPDAVDAVGE